ncbi:MAG: cobalt ECF transporter T component CbiQ [Archaeoglobaceae archaeon]|nr:cobalt ECF transporter T component CbiQ [Archaeoglobaceae archaeon]HDD36581.1 cobalt ECF transporter T component CbiQ [Archaeoglobus veneficus]
MIEYPEIDRYADLDSILHKFDPRAKIVSFLTLIFSIVLIPDLKVALMAFTFSVFILALSKLPLSFVFKYLKWVTMFVLSIFTILALTFPGEKTSFYFISLSKDGIYSGALISIRAIAATMLVFPMIGTMRFDETIKALYMLRIPNSLVQMLMFTYRYIFVFADEFHRMLTAMESKGFKLKTNLYSFAVIGRAIGMLFVKSYERAERVYQAMLSRGYTGNPKTIADFKMDAKDFFLATLIIFFAIFLHLMK